VLLSLTQWLMALYPEDLGFLRVFQYLTFRAVLAAMTALLIGLAFGPWVIRKLTEMKIGQLSFLNLDSPAEHPYGSGALGSKYQGQVGPTPSAYWRNYQ
jgi:hypothetical protein